MRRFKVAWGPRLTFCSHGVQGGNMGGFWHFLFSFLQSTALYFSLKKIIFFNWWKIVLCFCVVHRLKLVIITYPFLPSLPSPTAHHHISLGHHGAAQNLRVRHNWAFFLLLAFLVWPQTDDLTSLGWFIYVKLGLINNNSDTCLTCLMLRQKDTINAKVLAECWAHNNGSIICCYYYLLMTVVNCL